MGAFDEKPSPSRGSLRAVPQVRDDDPYIGQVFGGRYEIVSKVAEGSQARVYLARHVLIDRPVAVKLLLPVLASDKDLVERFLNEGRAAGSFGHANIVESLDMGYAPDGIPYLVLELLEGRTIAAHIDEGGRFSVGRAAYIGSQIASALAAAHARGIVHRDLKSDNVLLIHHAGRPDQAKVLDFGISKFTTRGGRVTTIKGRPLGTPGFMAPEQIEDPQNTDSRADVYGLGATLYDMLAGCPPFADVGFPKVLRLIVEEEPKSLASVRPDLPEGMIAIVERALRKAPEARFQDMAEFEEALLGFATEPVRDRISGNAESRSPPPPLLAAPPVAGAAEVSKTAPPSLAATPETPGTIVENATAALRTPVDRATPRPFTKGKQRRLAVMLGLTALLGLGLALAALSGRSHSREIATAAALVRAKPVGGSGSAVTLPGPAPVNPAGIGSAAAVVSVPVAIAASYGSHSAVTPAIAPSQSIPGRAGRVLTPSPIAMALASPSAANTALTTQRAGHAKLIVETQNCNPPFYFEGKKKLFKVGCL